MPINDTCYDSHATFKFNGLCVSFLVSKNILNFWSFITHTLVNIGNFILFFKCKTHIMIKIFLKPD